MTHGLTYGYDSFNEVSVFWDHLYKVKSREDEIWIGAFREVASYLKEQKSITYEIESKNNGFVITPNLNLDKELFNEKLTGVIDIDDFKSLSIH